MSFREIDFGLNPPRLLDRQNDLSPEPSDYFSVPGRSAAFDEANDDEDNDIYRGEPPVPPSPPRTPRPPSTVSSSSSSSSNSSVFGGRLGAISGIVERAIAHWARAWTSTSSLDGSSSTSSSTRPSIITMSKSYMSRRRRKRPSVADLHNARSEWEVHARIRAREEARQVPREFVLYIPQYLRSAPSKARRRARMVTDASPDVLHTTSLPQIVDELSTSLKGIMRTRRAQDVARTRESNLTESAPQAPAILHHDYMLPAEATSLPQPSNPEDSRPRRRGRKGRQRGGLPGISLAAQPQIIQDRMLDSAWWLDIASPTWEDMRTLGKLLHLHPLTLEDILLQDPREKLELFPKLGYYFVVFRAIESQKTRDRRRLMRASASTERLSNVDDEDIVGEVNVYLIVFREGICSFHFADISDHADAVRNKVLALAESGTVTMSSDWIAHGIMDSIVDSFFPFVAKIEEEMISIEAVMFSDDDIPSPHEAQPGPSQAPLPPSITISHSSSEDTHKEKYPPSASPALDWPTKLREVDNSTQRTRFSLPRRPIFTLRRVKSLINTIRRIVPGLHVHIKRSSTNNLTSNTVQRLARVRRLVTSLSRILATKSEVVAQVKKRLLMTGESGLGNGTGDDHDVFVYLGDVQDHIITLQQSLAHYERMLSHSHPTYLAHLRLAASRTKSNSDKSIMILTIVSMAVLCMQAVIGFNSMNVTLPRNTLGSDRHYVFGIVVVASTVVLFIYIAIVRWWWVSAARRRNW